MALWLRARNGERPGYFYNFNFSLTAGYRVTMRIRRDTLRTRPGRSLRRERTSGPPPARPPCPDPFGFASPTARRARPRAARRGRGDLGVAARQMRSDITRRRRQPRRVRTSLLSASTWAHPYGAIPAPAPPLGFILFGSIRPLVLPRGLHACAAWPSIGTPRDFRYGVRAEAPEPPSGVRSRSRSRRRTRPSGKARVPYRCENSYRAVWDIHKRLPDAR